MVSIRCHSAQSRKKIGLCIILIASLLVPAGIFPAKVHAQSNSQSKEKSVEQAQSDWVEAVDEKLRNFVPQRNPESAPQLLEAVLKQRPTLFTLPYLQSKMQWFKNQAAIDLGTSSDVENLTYSMFQQWIYLELYRVFRTEYLMMSYAKTLPLIWGMTAKRALANFNRYFPNDSFSYSPDLEQTRDKIAGDVENLLGDPSKVNKVRDTLLGNIEANYMALAYIDKKLEFLEKRFDSSDDRFVKQKKKLDQWRSTVVSSNAILHTKAFKKNVAPYYEKEVAESLLLRERASNDFQERFSKYIEESRSIKDLVDYLSNGELEALAKDLAKALQVKPQNKFRQRIEKTFSKGVSETLENLEETIFQHRLEVLRYDTENATLQANLWSRKDSRDHNQWLIKVFRENVVHWLIIEEFPYLQKGAETLTNFVNQEVYRKGWTRWKTYAGLGTLLMFSGLGRKSSKFSSWLGRGQNTLRFGALAAGGYISYRMLMDLYGQYQEYRTVQRLVRLNVDGLSLASIYQEEAIQKGLLWQTIWTGAAVFTNIWAAKSLKAPPKGLKKESWLGGVARTTWEGSPLVAKDIYRNLVRNLKHVRKNIRSPKVAMLDAGAAMMDVMTFFTQLVVMVPAAMPSFTKGLLFKVRGQVFTGVILGTVMGIMSVTVQNYINAASIKGLTFAFEQMGHAVPAYWQMNALSLDHRTKRDAFIFLYGHVYGSKKEIARAAGNIVFYKTLLANPNASEKDRARARVAVTQEKENIDNELTKLSMIWYEKIEFRSLINSLLKELNFGLLVSPSMEDPVRMTVMLKVGDSIFTHSTTRNHLENLKNRNVIPDFDLDANEIREFLESLPDKILG